jgi:aryl-alcohol dehydrogenase-like predicted oxidoreductase
MIRDFEREILPMALHFGMALAPWDVQGGGRLQSKKQVRKDLLQQQWRGDRNAKIQ